jgi:aryl-alcohol dehydrogenase-like predicted oxidoreductase
VVARPVGSGARCEDSLRRLDTDLYQMHRPDPHTDIDETLGVLSDLAGPGGSGPYSILTRGVESRVLPTAQRHGMGVLTFGPLNSGWLSGRSVPPPGIAAPARGRRCSTSAGRACRPRPTPCAN